MGSLRTIQLAIVILYGAGLNLPVHAQTESYQRTGGVPGHAESRVPAARVMPLGDSITHGGQGYASYRYALWFQLAGGVVPVDFAGTRMTVFGGDGGGNPNPAWYPNYYTTFDRHHEGYWGWRTDEILTRALRLALSNEPDVTLIHLGTNDVLNEAGTSYTLTVAVGNRLGINPYGPSTWGGYRVELMTANEVIGFEADQMTPTAGTFADVSLTLSSNSLPARHLGQALSVRLSITGPDALDATDFDHVRLVAQWCGVCDSTRRVCPIERRA